MGMNSDIFDCFILVPCETNTFGKEFRPQLRGCVENTYFLLDSNGKEGCYFDTDFQSILSLQVAWLKLHPEHTHSAPQKAWVIQALLETYKHDELAEHLYPILGLPHQQPIFKMYRDIGTKLSKEFLIFAHEKAFSAKQCHSFVLMSPDILNSLLDFRDVLNLSASHFLEISELLSDYCRKTNLSVSELLKKDDMSSILNQETLTLHQRTEQLKLRLKERRLPTLTHVNKHMSSLVESLQLPQHMSVTWDTTLENPGLDLNVKLSKKEDLSNLLSFLNKPNSLTGMSDILELQ